MRNIAIELKKSAIDARIDRMADDIIEEFLAEHRMPRSAAIRSEFDKVLGRNRASRV